MRKKEKKSSYFSFGRIVKTSDRFEFYQLSFLYAGISEIVFQWVENGCDLPIDEIKKIIQSHIDK